MEYYQITEKNDTRGKYLKKSDKELIRKLAQEEEVLKELTATGEDNERKIRRRAEMEHTVADIREALKLYET